MNATDFIQTNYQPQQESYKTSIVCRMLDAYGWHVITEFKRAHFAPIRAQIIQHLKLIPCNNVFGVAIQKFLREIAIHSDSDVLEYAQNIQEVLAQDAPAVQDLFGASFDFFKKLNLKPYEYHSTFHPTLAGHEG